MRNRPRPGLPPGTARHDGVAGLVLGVQGVPDCPATGLLAGVNPLSGLYAAISGVALSIALSVVRQSNRVTIRQRLRDDGHPVEVDPPAEPPPASLVIVSANDRIQEQLAVTGITDLIGTASVYPGDERVGATLLRAYRETEAWVAAGREA